MCILVLMFLFLLHIKDIDLCNSNICITWNSTPSHLTLICTIDKMHLRVFFDDPHGNTQADCLPPYANQCEAYYRNGSIRINITTSEVYFILKGIIDDSLDGLWGCRHGLRREKAETYISIGDTKGNQIKQSQSTLKIGSTGRDAITAASETHTLSTAKQTTSRDLSTATYLKNIPTDIMQISSSMGTNSTIDFLQDVTEDHREIKEFFMMFTKYGPLLGGIAIVLLFVSCNFWISRQCRRENVDLPGINPHSLQEMQKNVHASSIEVLEIDSDNSDYETINEDGMLAFPFVSASIERLSTSSKKQQTSKRISKSDSQSSSDRSYLDVIDDKTYLNPYQSINVTGDSDNIHTYCMITEECKYDIPSRSIQPDFKNEMNQPFSLEQNEFVALSNINQMPNIVVRYDIGSRIVVDCSNLSSLGDSSDIDSETLSHSKQSIENTTPLICDDESFQSSDVLKCSNVMSSLL